MALAPRRDVACRRPLLQLGVIVAAVLTCSGCSTVSAWRMSRDSSLSRGPSEEEFGDNRNWLARWLSPKPGASTAAEVRSPLVLGSNGWKPMEPPKNPVADEALAAAAKLMKEGKVAEGEAAYKKAAKDYKDSYWGEKAQFALSESLFRRHRYYKAYEGYEEVLTRYPSSHYRDTIVGREYEIAQIFLAQTDPEIKREQLPWTSHFNGTLPLFDTNGFALQVLEHVRHHEPDRDAPLGDDAVLQIADQHMKHRSYELAAMHYEQLATDYPKSPFVQRAQLAAIDARMKDYLGPEYDGAGLEKARETIKQTMAMFPERTEGNEKLYHTLDLINDADAERAYTIAEYYRRTGKVASAEFYYGKVRYRWPKSSWAAKSKTKLAALAKMPRTESLPSKIFSSPGSIDSFNSSNGMGGMGGMSPMGGMPGMQMGGMPGGMY